MGKIIKYEFRKQRTARLLILFGLLACSVAFIIGALTNDNMQGIAFALMLLGTLFACFYTGIESLLVFNKDLRTRQSHMLWMVPKSVWEILGGKFIAAILQMTVVFAAFAAALALCLTVDAVTTGGFKAVFEFLQEASRALLQVEIPVDAVLQFFLFWFLAWTTTIMIGFLAIIVSRTLFLKSRFSGLFSFVLFLLFNWLIESGYSLLCRTFDLMAADINIPSLLYYAVVCIGLFGLSGVLADKKLSV
jgi:ABC-2 type transport system permease protein